MLRNPSPPTLSALTHRFLSPLQSTTCLMTLLPCCGHVAKYRQQSKIRSSFNSDPSSCQSDRSIDCLLHVRATKRALASDSPTSLTFHLPDPLRVSSCVCPFTNRLSFTFSSNHVEARRAAHATLSSRVFCLSERPAHQTYCTFVGNRND